MKHSLFAPSSIYRFQLNADTPLKKITKLIPYLHELGIEGVYCSPLFQSAGASGYDVTDPNKLNPKIATAKDFEHFCATLHKYGMKQVLDIVPNHMGINGKTNVWWLDVLEKGPASKYAGFFDIDWQPGKVLLPILADVYGKMLKEKKFRLIARKGYWIRYENHELPVATSSYPTIKCHGLGYFNDHPKHMHELLEQQHYRLAYWKTGGHKINYRRFFNINELIALHMEKQKVFDSYHVWIFKLIRTHKVQGLRVDHPDGLFNPKEYLKRIQAHHPGFVVVEKILDFHETLPKDWNTQGTVGYDFLDTVNSIFVQTKNEQKFNALYQNFIGQKLNFETVLKKRKLWFIDNFLVNEMKLLNGYLTQLTRDFTAKDLNIATKEIMAAFPVYRTYIRYGQPISKEEREYVKTALKKAKISPSLKQFLQSLLLLTSPLCKQRAAQDFLMRFQEMCAPAMAKGLEDSTFYIYNRLISLNEVGGDPKYFGLPVSDFHAFNALKRAKWPLGFLTTSTHDTKFSEDMRMRINVLSEIPERWNEKIHLWQKMNGKFPDRNFEYFIYQMLIGIWPEKVKPKTLEKRLMNYVRKAAREAGVFTNWRTPNAKYEETVQNFVKKLIKPSKFLSDFLEFQQEISCYGRLNSLSELVLKIGSCGIADIYQGNEIFTYSGVDPDNRRKVDYVHLKKLLKSSQDIKFFITETFLNFRKKHKALFIEGKYIPLKVQDHIIGFMRTYKNQHVIVLAGRFFTSLPKPPIGAECWGKAEIALPKGFKPREFRDIFTGKKHKRLRLADIFGEQPFSVLFSSDNKRKTK